MAKNSIRDYSATASQNTDINSINIDENCPASNLNNSQRALMAHLKNVSTGAVNLETPAADSLTVAGDLTVDTNTLFVDSTNNEVGIGTLTPGGSLEVYKAGTSEVLIGTDNGGTAQLSLYENDDGTKEGLLKYDGTNNRVHLATSGNADALVIPRDGGDVGIGRNDPQNIVGSHGGGLVVKSASGRAATTTQVAFQDSSGNNQFSQLHNGQTSFSTGSTERLRIHTNGALTLKTTQTNPYDTNQAGLAYGHAGDYVLRNTGTGSLSALFNQQTEGSLLLFAHAGTTEGSVSISGTTVTFGGGHLARWSRLPDNSKDTAVVKGTVMTNLDQMVVWHHDAQAATYYEEGDELPDGVSVGDVKTAAVGAYDEDNEQLNCTVVSDTEGDSDVAGVFVKWDDSDDYNDFYLAMTGDMVIRIAQGTTVARGDLLMSAGDGTAKPQDDDIVRSKTIAKVTSTTVSHTYDDGSYLVPCVLMAC
tara:strand:- start:397 stop:1824 length:1428 start_codon:yes stop_codon:yes gene_type:complete